MTLKYILVIRDFEIFKWNKFKNFSNVCHDFGILCRHLKGNLNYPLSLIRYGRTLKVSKDVSIKYLLCRSLGPPPLPCAG
jgi:hypothetical protein